MLNSNYEYSNVVQWHIKVNYFLDVCLQKANKGFGWLCLELRLQICCLFNLVHCHFELPWICGKEHDYIERPRCLVRGHHHFR